MSTNVTKTLGPLITFERTDFVELKPVDNQLFTVAKVSGFNMPEARATARLFASAHPMLDLLEDLEVELDNRYDGAEDSPTRWMGEYLSRLTTVINQAKGV